MTLHCDNSCYVDNINLSVEYNNPDHFVGATRCYCSTYPLLSKKRSVSNLIRTHKNEESCRNSPAGMDSSLLSCRVATRSNRLASQVCESKHSSSISKTNIASSKNLMESEPSTLFSSNTCTLLQLLKQLITHLLPYSYCCRLRWPAVLICFLLFVSTSFTSIDARSISTSDSYVNATKPANTTLLNNKQNELIVSSETVINRQPNKRDTNVSQLEQQSLKNDFINSLGVFNSIQKRSTIHKKRKSKRGKKKRKRTRDRKKKNGGNNQNKNMNKRKRRCKRKKNRHKKMCKSLKKNKQHSPRDKSPSKDEPSHLERLYNGLGESYHLAVFESGKVAGEPSSEESNFSLIEVRSVSTSGIVTLKGRQSNMFICVTKKGKVVGRKTYSEDMCNFKEGIEMNRQNTYEAMSCGGNETCFLNINKHGQVRQVNNFSRASNEAHFLPRDPNNLLKEPNIRHRRHALRRHKTLLKGDKPLLITTIRRSHKNGQHVIRLANKTLLRYDQDTPVSSDQKHNKNSIFL